MAMRGVSMVLALVLLAAACTAEAAKIDTYNPDTCDGNPAYTFYVNGGTCQTFIDQGAVQIGEVSGNTRVTVHNQHDCEQTSKVAQIYGPGCVVQGPMKLRAVWIQG